MSAALTDFKYVIMTWTILASGRISTVSKTVGNSYTSTWFKFQSGSIQSC